MNVSFHFSFRILGSKVANTRKCRKALLVETTCVQIHDLFDEAIALSLENVKGIIKFFHSIHI